MEKLLSSPPEKSVAYVWSGALLYAPVEISNRMHAHFAATVLISLDEPFSLTLESGETTQHEIAVLAPNAPRGTDSRGQPLIDFLIDPDDPLFCYLYPLLDGRSCVSLAADAIQHLKPRLAGIFRGDYACADARQLMVEVLAQLCPQPLQCLPWDERVQAANAFMRACLPERVPSIPDVAAEVGLSESRFMHLFREQMGLPVRQYLLWLRIRHAMRYWAQGRALSEIALAAGFYDQAHFTRTIRRMTDYAPSMISDPEKMLRFLCEGC